MEPIKQLTKFGGEHMVLVIATFPPVTIMAMQSGELIMVTSFEYVMQSPLQLP